MRVLLADDHPLFRAGIATLMRAGGHEVVGEASNGFEALERARALQPDLVLMDITMPACDGIEATRLIKAEMPDVKVVVVTVSQDQRSVLDAVRAGAEGYLRKDMSEDDLERTLSRVAEATC